MLSKTLIVTFGGAGETFARYFNAEVERRLRAAGWDGPVPSGIRTLCFDIATRPDLQEPGVPTTLGANGRRVALASPQLEYPDYYRLITGDPRILPALAGSVADPDVPFEPPWKGAGQRPQVGQAVALASFSRIAGELDRELLALGRNETTDELRTVSRAVGLTGDEAVETYLFGVGSLGGGAGSSIAQPIVELLLARATMGDQWLRTNVSTIFFGPDIFADLPAAARDGVAANGLFALSTLINGYEATGDAPAPLRQLHELGGGTRVTGRRAAATNFVIGGRNQMVRYDHHNKPIAATATAVARMLLDPAVSAGLSAHLEANRHGTPVNGDITITTATATSRPVSSLHYGAVKTGGDVLKAYTAELLAGRALETLVRGHLAQRRDERERDEDVLARVTREALPRFLDTVRLGREQLLGDLFDRAVLRTHVKDEIEAIQRDTGAGNRRATGAQWSRSIEQPLTTLEQRLADEQAAARAQAAATWSTAVGAAARAAVVQCLAAYGAPTANAVVDAAAVHARELASELDRDRRERVDEQARTLRQRGSDLLARIANKVVRGNDASVAGAIDEVGKSLFMTAESAILAQAAELLREFDVGVLRPLGDDVARIGHALAHAAANEHRELVEGWPVVAVPQRLHPAENEILIEPVEAIPTLSRRLLETTTGVAGAEDAIAAAVEEIVTGRWPSTRAVAPGAGDVLAATRVWRAGRSGVSQHVSTLVVPGLLARARRWVSQREGALARHVGRTLAEYLALAPEHATRFADAVGQAIQCAEPLVSINEPVYARVHGGVPAPPALYLSPLPVAADSDAGRRLQERLRLAGVPDGQARELFDPASRTQAVEISGFLATPVLPLVLDNLLVPIQRDWIGRGSAAAREQFAAFRRTRPLTLFVPLSHERQLRFVRGWVAGELLGRIEPLVGAWDTAAPGVWTAYGRRGFPQRLLAGDVRDQGEVLAAVLESLPLAYAAFASQQYEELEAYMGVLELGDLEALREWALFGRVPDAVPVPHAAVAGRAADDAAARCGALLDAVTRFGDAVRDERDALRLSRATLLSVPRSWEIAELVLVAVEEVRAVIADVARTQRPGSGPSILVPAA